jgi:DnaK suppressor protein
MSKDIDKIRGRLEARLESLQGRLDEINETLRQPEEDIEEMAPEMDDHVLERLSHAGRTEVYLIEAALRRIEEGTYGKCIECGKPIAKRRLEALPEAERCLACAQRLADH